MSDYHVKEKNATKEEVNVPEGIERLETRKAYIPAVDIVDNDKETTIIADFPGVDSESIDITLEKNVLTIKGKQAVDEFPGHALVFAEYGVGDYERSFSLSEEVDRDGIGATMRDGVLTVTIPKMSPTTRKIAVSMN